MTPKQRPQVGPTLEQIHAALVAGFNGLSCSLKDSNGSPKILGASNSLTQSVSGGRYPFLTFRTGSFTFQPWKDFQQLLTWDIPAQLIVQGPGEDGEQSARKVLMDIIARTAQIWGLPVDVNGNVVELADEDTLMINPHDVATLMADWAGPYIKSVNVIPQDDGLCRAEIVFHVESLISLDTRVLKRMTVGVIGVNAVAPDGLFQNPYLDEGRGIALVVGTTDEAAQGGYADQSTPLLPTGTITRAPIQAGGNAQVAGLLPSEAVKSVNVTPYSGAVSTGTPTLQLAAIATHVDWSTLYVTNQAAWTSSAPTIATVSNSGLVTKVAAGSCTVSCIYNGVLSNAVSITVS